ncbi:MAG: DUF4351 domain-containing protein [Bryobacterales bacterium]|nr:DUF4351 domain-containing protein [Bryobacterales bacterium]
MVLVERGMPDEIPKAYHRSAGDSYRSFNLRVVKPWEIPARDALALERRSVLPWIPLMKATDEDHEEVARRLTQSQDRDLVARTSLMAGLRYGDREKFFRRLQRMITREILKESWVYQQIEAEGVEKGRQQGRQEGRQEGWLSAERHMLRKLITSKFGDVPEWAEKRLSEASLELLETWSERILTASSLEDLLR